MDSITITLGDKAYAVPQLNLGQLRDLAIGVTLPDVTDPQEAVRRSFDRAVNVISTGLREEHPEMTPEAIYKIRGLTSAQMREANDAILKHSGLISAKKEPSPQETPSGEAPGAA
jgi:hypothetical protein